jgi:hypothetical protein
MAYTQNRKARAGSTAAALEAVATGFPEPPVKLLPRERPFWDAVMHARMPAQWCEYDLRIAVLLVQGLCDLERHRGFLLDEGEIDLNNNINKRSILIEKLVTRVAVLSRTLQLNALAKGEHAAHLGASKGEAQRVVAALDDDPEGLFARPTTH